jgi:ABC-type transport system involved in multi-copper enzyme maturation permease subunit
MAFWPVYMRTLRSLLGLRRTVIMYALGLWPSWFFPLVIWQRLFESGTMSLDMQTSFIAGYFVLMSFLWIAGFFLAYLLVGSSGLGMIANEQERGTLLLLISKPISRTHLLLGKFAALVSAALIYEMSMLLMSVALLTLLLDLDPQTVSVLTGIALWTFLFGILISSLFAAVSMLFSTVVRSGAARGAVFTGALLFVFFFGPIMRLAFPSEYSDYWLYYIDAGHNLGNAYVALLDDGRSAPLTPQGQAWVGIATGAYTGGPGLLLSSFLGGPSNFDPDISGMPVSLDRTTYVHPLLSLTLIVAATAAALYAARNSLNRREIQ